MTAHSDQRFYREGRKVMDRGARIAQSSLLHRPLKPRRRSNSTRAQQLGRDGTNRDAEDDGQGLRAVAEIESDSEEGGRLDDTRRTDSGIT